MSRPFDLTPDRIQAIARAIASSARAVLAQRQLPDPDEICAELGNNCAQHVILLLETFLEDTLVPRWAPDAADVGIEMRLADDGPAEKMGLPLGAVLPRGGRVSAGAGFVPTINGKRVPHGTVALAGDVIGVAPIGDGGG